MKFIRNKEILSRKESDGFALFNPENGELHKLNKHAFFLFEILSEELSLEQVMSKTKSKYSFNNSKEAKEMISKILKELESKKIILTKK